MTDRERKAAAWQSMKIWLWRNPPKAGPLTAPVWDIGPETSRIVIDPK